MTYSCYPIARGLYYFAHDDCLEGVDLDEEVRLYGTDWLSTDEPGGDSWKAALHDLIEFTQNDKTLNPKTKKQRLQAYRLLEANPSNDLPPIIQYDSIRTNKPATEENTGGDIKVRRSK